MTIESLMRLGWVQGHGQRVSEVRTNMLHPYKRRLNFQAQQARKEALSRSLFTKAAVNPEKEFVFLDWLTEPRESRLGSLKCKKAC